MSDDRAQNTFGRLERDWTYWEKDETVVKSGGLVDPGYLGEFHRMGCGLVRHLYLKAAGAIARQPYADQIEALSLFFIESSARNAVALEREAARGVGVHIGLIEAIWVLLYNAIGTGGLLPHWFNDDAPLRRPVTQAAALNDPIWREAAPTPWSGERIAVHFELTARILDLVVHHELAHHTRGHIAYLRAQFGLSHLDEAMHFSAEEGPMRDALRNLEYDADHAALDMLMASLDSERPLSTWTAEQASREYFIQALAIIVLFQLLDQAHTPMSRHYGLSHPAPVHRAMRMTAALARTFSRQFDWPESLREEEHDLAWLAAADLAGVMNMPEGRWRGRHTRDMDFDRFRREEEEFISFASELDARNAGEDR